MRKLITIVRSDIDGTEGAEEMQFGLDGAYYTIDVSNDEAKGLHDALAPYIDHARRTGRVPGQKARRFVVEPDAKRAAIKGNGRKA